VTGSAVYPASNSMATRELSLMVKGPGRETGHSPPPSAQNWNRNIAWNYISTAHTSSWCCG